MDDYQARFERLIARLRLFGTDTQKCEVKSASQGLPQTTGDTLSAFANGSGGTLLLGISEKEGFAPVDGFDSKGMQSSVASLCADGLEPPLRPDIDLVTLDSKPALMVRVTELPPRDKPCYVKKKGLRAGSFIRTGDGDRRMTDYEIDRLLEEHVQPRHDAAIVPEATLDDLDKALVAGLVARERAVHPRVSEAMDDETILINLNAIKRDTDGALRPTLAGLLALGAYPQRFFPRLCITFASFPGTTKADIGGSRELLDTATLVGPIPYLVTDAIAAVKRNMRAGGVIEGAFRQDVVDYPPEAIREAVTNALMHRDYSQDALGMQVQVNMYADRIEITNPGGLYGTLTLDMLGCPGESATRNQRLSLLLEETPYPGGGFVAENRGTGYQRIVSELAQNLLPPPEPQSSAARFSLTMYKRRVAEDERANTFGSNIDAAILAHLDMNESVSARELAEMSGLSRAGILRHIKALVEADLLEPLYPGRSSKQRYRRKK